MPEQISKETKIITGIATRTTNALESNSDTATIPGLWSRFFSEDIGGQVSIGNATDTIYGVYTDYESDHSGAYTLILGKESDIETTNTDKLVSKQLPAGKYLKFERAGKLPDVVVETWKEIWAYFEGTTEYQRLYTADYEEYNGDEGVCINIAVSKTQQ